MSMKYETHLVIWAPVVAGITIENVI